MNKNIIRISYLFLIFIILAITSIILPGRIYKIIQTTIRDKLGLTKTKVKEIVAPHSIDELQTIIRSTNEPIAIMGTGYSQGGQIAISQGIIIDTKHLNKIIHLDHEEKIITVQTGATWYDVQKYIDPYNLSIASMQSYNNFSIGGSLSVNVHGRDIHHCQLVNTVKSLQIVTADGNLITADRNDHSDLFKAAIGGYGLLGVITQVTLQLTDNIPLERKTKTCLLENFDFIFFNTITTDPSVVFYNTDLFPKAYKKCLIITWHTTNKAVTDFTRLQEQKSPFYIVNQALEFFIKRILLAKYTRPLFEELKTKKPLVVNRNNEMSYSLYQLTVGYHFPSIMTLQEYFIPVKYAQTFAKTLRSILKKNWVNVLNISIRYVKADTTSIMSYAKEESFSFVLYLNLFNVKTNITRSCIWTQKIIDAALENNGSYYLPYLMCATKKQFHKAYPQFKKLLEIKKIYDPTNKFQNKLLKKYV